MGSIDKEQYWMITGEWLQVIGPPQSSISTPENPNPQNQEPTIIEMKRTEFIEMHPAKYSILIADERPRYALVFAMPISLQVYQWVKELYSEAAKAAKDNIH